jgi:hypothetical protein
VPNGNIVFHGLRVGQSDFEHLWSGIKDLGPLIMPAEGEKVKIGNFFRSMKTFKL